MDLKSLREQIDLIDDELIQLLAKRMAISAQVADYKKEHNMPIHVPAREQEILHKVAMKVDHEIAAYIQDLYSMIFKISRNYQSNRNTITLTNDQAVVDSE